MSWLTPSTEITAPGIPFPCKSLTTPLMPRWTCRANMTRRRVSSPTGPASGFQLACSRVGHGAVWFVLALSLNWFIRCRKMGMTLRTGEGKPRGSRCVRQGVPPPRLRAEPQRALVGTPTRYPAARSRDASPAVTAVTLGRASNRRGEIKMRSPERASIRSGWCPCKLGRMETQAVPGHGRKPTRGHGETVASRKPRRGADLPTP